MDAKPERIDTDTLRLVVQIYNAIGKFAAQMTCAD